MHIPHVVSDNEWGPDRGDPRWEDAPRSVDETEPFQWWRRHDEYAEVGAR